MSANLFVNLILVIFITKKHLYQIGLILFNKKLPLLFDQVRCSLHDVKAHPTLVDMTNSSTSASQLLADFKSSMSQSELLNCADAAALLISDFDSCGIAYFDVTSSCGAFSITKKSCATGYYSFGHEIGHNFGANHNREKFDSHSGIGYGHLIQVNWEI